MAGNQQNWRPHLAGRFLLTVQLDPLTDRRAGCVQQELAFLTRGLVSLLESHRLPATWAVSDPAHSAATALIVRSAVAHELAILGDAHWVGPTAGRTRFARELARRTLQARTAGLPVSTFVPRIASVERHIDLVVKHRLTALAGPPDLPSARQSSAPRALHYGVWELPINGSLPVQASWFSTGGWSTWRRIRRAAHDGATFHLMIDAPALVGEGQRAEKTLTWLLRRVAELRDSGLLQVETLRTAAAELANVRPASPQKSILRRAA